MKKILALMLALVMVFALAACGQQAAPAESSFKAGLICLHDENSGYDNNFIVAFKAACEAVGAEAVIVTGVPEDQTAHDKAAELADAGCAVVFTDSYGHQPYVLEAAQEFPEVQFTSCTGDMAQSAGVENFHNAFADIYQGRYLAGVAAGMKLQEMIDNGEVAADAVKVGYVGAMPYAEVISGYTSWFLGVKSIVPNVTMDVIYTGSWYDETAENTAAKALIAGGAVLISQHADSMGAPNACERNEAGPVPNVSYNGSTMEACPNSYIISSRINWQPYFEYAIKAVMNGENYDTDWCGSLETGSVALTELNENVAAAGTAEKLAEVEAALSDGSLKVFDTANWTKDGETLTSYDKVAFYEGNECIWDGYFHESETRSAPYFDIIIDGITIK